MGVPNMLQVDEASCAGNGNCRIGKMVFIFYFFLRGTKPLSGSKDCCHKGDL